MIPFPGESVAIRNGVDLTGGGEEYVLQGVLSRREFTQTATTGTVWRVWVNPGNVDYLEESGLSCDVSWVIEVASGTVTLDLGELLDPEYGDIVTPMGTSLGSHTVTGPATLVVPSGFTADQAATGDDALMLEIVGTSGSAEVQQVKLRVWPTGGPLGGWSDPLPSWSTTPSLPSGYETAVDVNANEVAATREASWDATMAQGLADWAAVAPGPHSFTSITTTPGYLRPSRGGALSAFHASGDGGTTWGTLASISAAILVVEGANPAAGAAIDPAAGLVDGVDYIRPPNEVRGEAGPYTVQQVGSGSTGWVNPYAYVGTSSEATPVESPTLGVDTLDDLTITSLGVGLTGIDLDASVGGPLTTPGPDGSVTESVALPTDARFIIIRLAHTAAAAEPAWPAPPALAGSGGGVIGFGVGTPDVDFDPMLTYAILPPYRVWVPTAITVEPLRLIQRGDGLGMGSGRLLGAGTRQSSSRVFGSL